MGYTIIYSSIAEAWLDAMEESDPATTARIAKRIERMESGNFGDSKSVGGGVLELRLDFGPGYRVYVARKGFKLIVVLCGGDKSTQRADIQLARQIAMQIPRKPA